MYDTASQQPVVFGVRHQGPVMSLAWWAPPPPLKAAAARASEPPKAAAGASEPPKAAAKDLMTGAAAATQEAQTAVMGSLGAEEAGVTIPATRDHVQGMAGAALALPVSPRASPGVADAAWDDDGKEVVPPPPPPPPLPTLPTSPPPQSQPLLPSSPLTAEVALAIAFPPEGSSSSSPRSVTTPPVAALAPAFPLEGTLLLSCGGEGRLLAWRMPAGAEEFRQAASAAKAAGVSGGGGGGGGGGAAVDKWAKGSSTGGGLTAAAPGAGGGGGAAGETWAKGPAVGGAGFGGGFGAFIPDDVSG